VKIIVAAATVAITTTGVPHADPRGPITDDFKRGACYVLDLWNQTLRMPDGTKMQGDITLSGKNSFTCPMAPQ